MLRKIDIINSLILGELIFLFLLPTQLILHFFEKLHLDQVPLPVFFWWFAVLLPAATVLGYWALFAIGKKITFVPQLARYGLIGVVNTVMSLGIINTFILFTGVSGGYLADVFAAVAFVLVVTNSFFWNKYWTFSAGQDQKTVREYVEFFVVSLSGAFINVGLFHLLVNVIGPQRGIGTEAWANIVVLIGIPISLAWNFTGYKLFVFKKTASILPEQPV